MAQSSQAYDMARNGWLMHLVAAVLWLLLGAWEIGEYVRFNGYALNPEKAPAGLNNPSDFMFGAMLLAGLFISFAIIAIVLSFLIRWKVLEPLQRLEYEWAARYITILGGAGLLFGFGIGGALLFLSFVRLKDAMRAQLARPAVPVAPPVQASLNAPRCPACGTPARFIHGAQRWHCDGCARFL